MDTFLLNAILCAVVISAVQSTAIFNAALNKDASQSSVYIQNSGGLTADKAVDGNSDPNLEGCACTAHSDYDVWWKVDLGKNYHVTTVIVTNRLSFEYRLHDFTVTVSFVSGSPGIVCGLYPGDVPGGATVEVSCDQVTLGRYVTITKPVDSATDILTLCEVQVMVVNRSYMVFKRLIGKTTTTDMSASITTTRHTCAHICKDSDNCLAITYNAELNECLMLNTTENTDAVANNGWQLFILQL